MDLDIAPDAPLLTSVEFLFEDPDVFYVQQSNIVGRLPEDIGELEASARVPDIMGLKEHGWNPVAEDRSHRSYFDKLLISRAWLSIFQGHTHRGEDIFSTFSFLSLTKGRRPELVPLLQKASIDMIGWLGDMCLLGCTPAEVKLSTRFKPDGSEKGVHETQDVTARTLPVFRSLAQVAGLLE